ncbi:MAG: hypothetical protein ACI92O_000526 [Colwellia sp.]|jgi:hypothetical protein
MLSLNQPVKIRRKAMNKYVYLVVIFLSTLNGCSSYPDKAFIDQKVFKETNRPFLSTYQTEHAQTTMVNIDKSNDQVVVRESTEYVFWMHNYNSAIPIQNRVLDHKIPDLNTKEAPFVVPEALFNSVEETLDVCNEENKNSCKVDETSKSNSHTEILYDLGECHFKGC